MLKLVNEYGTKIIQSGKVLEIYEYQKPIKRGYSGGKGGRKKEIIKSEELEETEENKEINREKVLNRARRDLRRIVNSNIELNSKFLTLTFAENITDVESANYEFKKFVKRLNYNLGFKVAYSCVVEFQKRGAVHYHVILYNTPQKLNMDELTAMWGNGFIKLNKIKNVDNVGAYICKYMTKCEDEKKLRGKKIYFNSRGLKKCEEIKEPALVKAICSSLDGQAPKYSNVFENEYNKIYYQQYIIK